MKGKSLLLVLLLLTLSASSHVNRNCSGKNDFLEDLRKGDLVNITIFDKVDRMLDEPFPHCSSEWNAHGTCCEGEDLVSFAQFEIEVIQHNAGRLKADLSGLMTLVEQTVDMPVESRQYGQQILAGYGAASDKCWNYISKVRGSSLCSVCSGRSEVFFTPKKDKIYIDPPTCQQAIENCESFFSSLSWIIEFLDDIARGSPTRSFSPQNSKLLKSVLNTFKHYSPPNWLIHDFKIYNHFKKDLKRAEILSARLCSRFVNIRKKPYVMAMDEVLQKKMAGLRVRLTAQAKRQILLAATRNFRQQRLQLLDKKNDDINAAELRLNDKIKEAEKQAKGDLKKLKDQQRRAEEAFRDEKKGIWKSYQNNLKGLLKQFKKIKKSMKKALKKRKLYLLGTEERLNIKKDLGNFESTTGSHSIGFKGVSNWQNSRQLMEDDFFSTEFAFVADSEVLSPGRQHSQCNGINAYTGFERPMNSSLCMP